MWISDRPTTRQPRGYRQGNYICKCHWSLSEELIFVNMIHLCCSFIFRNICASVCSTLRHFLSVYTVSVCSSLFCIAFIPTPFSICFSLRQSQIFCVGLVCLKSLYSCLFRFRIILFSTVPFCVFYTVFFFFSISMYEFTQPLCR